MTGGLLSLPSWTVWSQKVMFVGEMVLDEVPGAQLGLAPAPHPMPFLGFS